MGSSMLGEHSSRTVGLSFVTALSLLSSQLSASLKEYDEDGGRGWRRSFLHHSVRWSCLHWPGVVMTTLSAFLLLYAHTLTKISDGTSLVCGCAVLVLLLVGLVVMARVQWLRREEMPQRVRRTVRRIQELLDEPPSDWLDGVEELLVPPTSAVPLQWVYRDGRLVNLPASLLVDGDIIALRPGSHAPTELRGIQTDWLLCEQEEEHVVLSRSDVFSHLSAPPSPLDTEQPRPQQLLQPQLFRVLKTPAVEAVKMCLDSSGSRPVSVLDNERFTVQRILERGPAPLTLALLMIMNLLRYALGAPGVGPWHVSLLQIPVNGVLPLLPLTFPLLWILVHVYGEVRVLLQVESQPITWQDILRRSVCVLSGRSPTLCFTSSLLHSLGSVTVLCCVDKQGVLSWGMADPEKILFFTKNAEKVEREKKKEREEREMEREKEEKQKVNEDATKNKTNPLKPKHVALEMLSLSAGQAHVDDTRVQFDDTRWQRHASSLRPLGLALQLALCNPAVAMVMQQHADHLTHAALGRKRPIHQPVTPPWGLCHLPRILGLSSSSLVSFQKRTSAAAYILPTIPCTGDMGVAMRRRPISHLISLVVQHTQTGEMLAFSYGSADAILAACTEFWDGEDIQSLNESQRRRVCDVYQRSCMAGQCVCVSYKPIVETQCLDEDATCVELKQLTHIRDSGVFLGVCVSQHQARPEVVRLIGGLDSACIRFVYFSQEEEVRSKVFAEKMGLETGWNCHISLQSEDFQNLQLLTQEEEEFLLPQPIIQIEAESRVSEPEGVCLTEDLNRAKLPKGIENVRPHLEKIDNVPLLVPLFTDCTPPTVCEMVCVMQEYGEVVCCLGSSQNINNNAVYLQSDISLALDPVLGSCCWTDSSRPPYSPLYQLSSAICGLACTLQLPAHKHHHTINLIRQARHTTAGIRKCFLFLLQCQLSLVLIQILACVCQLPPPLGTSDVLFLSCFYYPLLSVSLLGKPSDGSIMKVPTGKNLPSLPNKTLRFFGVCFLVKFGLTVCVNLGCFICVLHDLCLQINLTNKTSCHPNVLFMNSSVGSPDWFGVHADGLCLAQKITTLLVLLNAMCTSVSHVHRSAPMWKQSPFTNKCWSAVITSVPILNVSIATISHLLWQADAPYHTFSISDVSIATWLIGILWLLPLIFINEGFKLHEIRMRVRYQKRQKLQFDTKLGMNSPF